MKAPEKIYIQSFNVSEEDTKFDKSKMFFDDVWTEEPELGQENIEYIRTNAFIEKACEWLKEHKEDVETEDNGIVGWIPDCFIDEFRNYMKGE